jgi:hypothetical protein
MPVAEAFGAVLEPILKPGRQAERDPTAIKPAGGAVLRRPAATRPSLPARSHCGGRSSRLGSSRRAIRGTSSSRSAIAARKRRFRAE